MSTLNTKENYKIAKLKVEEAKIKYEAELNRCKVLANMADQIVEKTKLHVSKIEPKQYEELYDIVKQITEETKRYATEEEIKQHDKEADKETKRCKEIEKTEQIKEIKKLMILGKELNNQEIINDAIELLKKYI